MQQVARHLGLNILRLVCVLERIVRLVVVCARRTHACNHDRLAVAAQRKLEQARQLAVAVGYMPAPAAALAQRTDAAAQRKQRAIDIRTLFHAQALVVRRRSALRSGKVDNVQRATRHLLHGACGAWAAHNIQLEYGMAAAAHRIRLGRALRTPPVAVRDHLEHLLRRCRHMLRDAHDRNLAGRILAQREAWARRRRRWREQVADRLVVDLKVAQADLRLILVRIGSDALVQSLHREVDQAGVLGRPTNRVRLAAARRLRQHKKMYVHHMQTHLRCSPTAAQQTWARPSPRTRPAAASTRETHGRTRSARRARGENSHDTAAASRAVRADRRPDQTPAYARRPARQYSGYSWCGQPWTATPQARHHHGTAAASRRAPGAQAPVRSSVARAPPPGWTSPPSWSRDQHYVFA